MARTKKPENETIEETTIRQIKEDVSNHASRNEKVAWNRKMDNMVSLLAKLTPIEDQISDLLAQKQPILDDIQSLRSDMVNECIHPYQMLIYKHDDNEIVECKFCNRKFALNK